MKKILAILLCLAMLLAVGCGQQGDGENASDGEEMQQESSVPEENEEDADEEEEPSGQPPQLAEPRARADHNLLTGEYSEEADLIRPVAVMINNLPGSYPHWGISGASVVVEAVSEGDYPSMMCLFDNLSEIPEVGPVGPARDMMWQLALPSRSILMQIGGNAYADNLLNLYQYQNLDGYYVGVTGFDFDRDRDADGYPNEFCWYTKNDLLVNALDHYGMGQDTDAASSLFEFAGEAAEPKDAQPANKLRVFFSPEVRVRLDYEDGVYLKEAYNEDPHMDVANDTQLAFENCLVLFCASGVKDDGYTRDYDLTEGTGAYLTQGVYLPVRWQKGHPDQPVRLYTMDGDPLPMNPGRTYLALYGGFEGQEVVVRQDDTVLELPEAPGTESDEETDE